MTLPSDARELLLEVAERLFAEHGPDGVSLRDIARAAGQRNNSAVQYHFGSREGLVTEVFRRRMEPINAVRADQLAALDTAPAPADLSTLMEVLLLPLADHVRRGGPDSTYARFMVRTLPTLDFATEAFAESNAVQRELGRRMRARVAHLSDDAFEHRVRLTMTMAVSALADFERRWQLGRVAEDGLEPMMREVTVMATAALTAPATQ